MLATYKQSAARRRGSPSKHLSGNWARLLHLTTSLFVAGAGLALAPNRASGQDPPPPPASGGVVNGDVEGVETLTHGPIHEAFAAPTGTNPEPGPIIAKQPPPNIDEEPPDLKAEGAIWISGYWEFDDELKDFIWISGNWRVPPPDMRWVPSYWVEAEGGWQRVPGFWISADAGELEYRQMPPESLEVGPSGPAPADNYFWIPGTWNYYDTGYRWRTGYWSPYQDNWVWCPARWVWTPGGCVYIAGYRDHRLAYRGHMFAPIHFRTALYSQPGWRYRPWCVVPTNNLLVHLWIRPQWNCYYFGNYYGPQYANFVPWHRWGSGIHRHGYDPLLTWCNVHYRRQGIDYTGRIDQWHRHFSDHEDARPPRTWRDQVDLVARGNIDERNSQRVLAADLRDVARRDDLPVRLTQMNDKQRDALSQVNEQLRDLRSQRVKVEADSKTRVTARVPLDRGEGGRDGGSRDNVGRPGREAGPRAGIDTQARVQEATKLRLPKLDAATTASIDAALGTRSSGRTRDLPTGGDLGRGPQTGRVDRPSTTGADRTNDVLRGLREKGILPADEPRVPRTDRTGRGVPSLDNPGRSSRVETPQLEIPKVEKPRVEVPSRTPRIDLPDRTPRVEIPQTSPRSEIPKLSPRVDTPRIDTSPRSTPQPRVDIPQAPKFEIPNIDRTPRSTPRVDIPKVTPRLETPRVDTSPRSPPQPRVDIPRTAPKFEIPNIDRSPRSAPRIDIPRVNPRMDAPRVEVPRSAPRVDIPRVNVPQFNAPRSSPKIEIPRSDGGGNRGRARDRD